MLRATGLSKFYGSVPAVQNVTFSLEPGQILLVEVLLIRYRKIPSPAPIRRSRSTRA